MSRTHGKSRTKFWYVWCAMRNRCRNKNRKDYKHYGGRGITVDPHWNSFENFETDMGPTYKEGLELDRINNDKGYSKENCRWSTRAEQLQNYRKNHNLTYKGKTMSLTMWSKAIGMNYSTLRSRINDSGWSVKESLTLSLKKTKRKQK